MTGRRRRGAAVARAGSGGSAGRPASRPRPYEPYTHGRGVALAPVPGPPRRAAAARRRRDLLARWTAARRSGCGCRSSPCGPPQTSPSAKPKPGVAGVQHGRRVRARPALAALAQVGADGEVAPLRDALAAPAAGQVEQLAGPPAGPGRRAPGRPAAYGVVGEVRQPRPGTAAAQPGRSSQVEQQAQPGHVVDGVDLDQRRTRRPGAPLIAAGATGRAVHA